MKRWHWNYVIDASMFLSMMALAGIGLLLKYVLLPGRDARLKYDMQVDLAFLGLDRHQWATIHFIVSLVLLTLLLLHIILHWSMIVTLYRRFVPVRSTRAVLTWTFIIASIVMVGFPLVARPQLMEQEPMRRFSSEESALSEPAWGAAVDTMHIGRTTPRRQEVDPLPQSEAPAETHTEREHTLDIRGSMTLQQVAERYDVPEEHILRELGITERRAGQDQLGQLRRRYNFTMSDIEDIILAWWKEHPPPPSR